MGRHNLDREDAIPAIDLIEAGDAEETNRRSPDEVRRAIAYAVLKGIELPNEE